MVSKYFESEFELSQFLQWIHYQYSVEELGDIFTGLYCGYGDVRLDEELRSQLKIQVFEQKIDKLNFEKENI